MQFLFLSITIIIKLAIDRVFIDLVVNSLFVIFYLGEKNLGVGKINLCEEFDVFIVSFKWTTQHFVLIIQCVWFWAQHYGIIQNVCNLLLLLFPLTAPKSVPIDGKECDWNVSFLFTWSTHTIARLSWDLSTHTTPHTIYLMHTSNICYNYKRRNKIKRLSSLAVLGLLFFFSRHCSLCFIPFNLFTAIAICILSAWHIWYFCLCQLIQIARSDSARKRPRFRWRFQFWRNTIHTNKCVRMKP